MPTAIPIKIWNRRIHGTQQTRRNTGLRDLAQISRQIQNTKLQVLPQRLTNRKKRSGINHQTQTLRTTNLDNAAFDIMMANNIQIQVLAAFNSPNNPLIQEDSDTIFLSEQIKILGEDLCAKNTNLSQKPQTQEAKSFQTKQVDIYIR